MDDPTEKMSYGPGKKVLNPFALKRPKKRSLVERELETNMTSRMISPVTISDGVSTSRYGRARRMKSENDNKNTTIDTFKSPTSENTPTKSSPAIKEVKSDSKGKPYNKTETPKKALERSLDNIDNIYQENKTFSRFKTSNNSMSSAKKVYIQKDLIQNRDDDDDDGIVLIKDLFSPKHSPKVTPRTARKKKTENSSSKPQLTSKKPNGHEDILSVVKTLDFDTIKKDEVVCETMEKPQNNSNNKDSMKNIKIKHEIEVKPNSSEMIDIEAACPFQVGDLAWARMGTFPFWPCIITRDPASDVFVKQKLFGRVEHNILHVTFFADNGRRSWVVDNMLRQYKGLDEFMSTREKFTPEDKKKDPRLYAAFFISEKKHSLWKTSVEEAEMINREPKRTRIDAFNELLYKFRESKKKSSKVSRTDSDVSLSESLYDSLFSEDDSKDDSVRTRNRSKNKSLDVSDVVTACLDNMAAKTGNSKIQRQSHMDRWLQKAKSKTPEKVKTNLELTPIKVPILVPKTEPVDTFAIKVEDITQLVDKIVPKIEKPDKPVSNRSKKRKLPPKEVKITKVYGLRRSYESQNSFVEESEDVDMQNVSKSKSNGENDVTENGSENTIDSSFDISQSGKDNSPTTAKNPTSVTNDNCDDVLNAIDELLDDDSPKKKSTKIAKEISKKESTETSTTMEITTINIEIKPEIMDVDEDQEQEVKYAEKSTTTESFEVFDSPVKIEKESDTQIFSSNDAINENTALDKTVSPSKSVLSLNGVSPVKINKTPKKTASTKDKTSKPTQTSPLKNNEMVLIPENIKLTDDDNSLTAFDDVNAKNVDEKSTNSTVETVKLNKEECCLKDKPLTILNDAPKDTMAILTLDSISADKAHKDIVNAKETENYNNNMSNDEVVEDDINTSKEDKLNESGVSESILQIGNEIVDTNVKSEPDLKSSYMLIVPEVVVNDEALPSPKIEQESNEPKTIINEDSTLKIDEETANEKNKSNPFLDDSRNTDCVDSASDKKQKKEDFREEDMNKPPDLTSSSNEIDDLSDEDSEDEPSPEFEPLEDEIKEDFRQHMICIENNITDKKDDAQWVKVCNDIAILEESKVKLNDVKSSIGPGKNQEIVALNKSNLSLSDEQILSEISHENDKLTPSPKSDLSNQSLTKEIKTELLDNITEFVENSIKSPRDKRRYKLSLRRNKSKTEIENLTKSTEYIQDSNIINPLYKTIDQIEDIIKSKPKRLPLENGEVYISGIMENGLKREIVEDDDFDVDNASVSSEDSEVSLPQNNVPARRSLRSKDKRVGLQDPEFLTYLELRQDDLMEEHPELTRDDIILYLYKTYTYAQNLLPEMQLEESPLKVKQETPTIKQEARSRTRKSKKQVQPKNTIENFFREKYNKNKNTDIEMTEKAGPSKDEDKIKRESLSVSPVDSGMGNSKDCSELYTPVTKRITRSVTPRDCEAKEIKVEQINNTITDSSPGTPKRLRKKTLSPRTLACHSEKRVPVVVISPMQTPVKVKQDTETRDVIKNDIKLEILPEQDTEPNEMMEIKSPTDVKKEKPQNKTVVETKQEDTEPESLDSDSEVTLRQLRSKVLQEKQLNVLKKEISELKEEDTQSVSSDNEPLLKLKPKKDKNLEGSYEDPDFLKYMELKQDTLIDENPHLSHNEMKAYLYKTWIYEKASKSDLQKNDDIESSNLVKGLNPEPVAPKRNAKRKPKVEKVVDPEESPKEKPKRKTISHYYNEELLSDVEEELEVYEIFKTKKSSITVVSKPNSPKKERQSDAQSEDLDEVEVVPEEVNTLDDVELYFKQLISPKPSVFKGLIREKVCGICEDISNLLKCKTCNGMFHFDCVNRVVEITDSERPGVAKGRRKKKKTFNGRKSNENEDVSEEIIDEAENMTVDASILESQFEAKMKEIMEKESANSYESYSSEEEIDWSETVPGKCELIDIKLKHRNPPIDAANFKCINCRNYDKPICFVCKSPISKTGVKNLQKCTIVHCHSYYHLECLDHWPQTQFNGSEWSRTKLEQQESLTCPRHVCHTCVSDDPRGCKTRFSGDKLAKCVRCPATYHAFNKCLPAGTQILTASFIICPRHYENRPGKVPCHVNTGWCFICALGGSLICCEYCPTSFHAECLNIKPPEGNYMCEDCETGRLPLYGEMVWVKLGHYRWWPGVILHPSEIPDNIMAVKHGLGEFVVRFFGQYDHYWVNRGRVFPYQEGDSGRVSSQRSKIDAAFTTAMEHAQRAYEILKNAQPNEEESLEISSSLLPPHYVKLKSNKPTGSLLGRRLEDPSLSLTQCECSPADREPCGPNSQCLNRVLLTECGPTCRAGDRCNNRAFERRQYPKLTPYRASHRGWGLKTLEDIKAGQFVIEYVGELIDEKEFQWRMSRKHEIRDENFYFLTLDKERMIDAGPKGNLARFMNHCCEPNCETQKWTVLGDIRVGLFAIDDIKANSEVTFNYNLECTGIEKKRCLCGAKRCSGYIGAKPKQLNEPQTKKNGITGKRKYTKRKESVDSPSTSKYKPKKPLGRPRKDKPTKELTEIEKDLLIIKSATPNSDESRPQSDDDKKIDSNTTNEGINSNDSKEKASGDIPKLNGALTDDKVLKTKLDPNATEEIRTNGIESKLQKKMNSIKDSIESKSVKRKATDELLLNSEPSAKRLKSDKRIEVGD